MNMPVVGIRVSRDPGDQEPMVYDLAQRTGQRLGVGQDIPRKAVVCFGDYWRPKYSVPNQKMVEAVNSWPGPRASFWTRFTPGRPWPG